MMWSAVAWAITGVMRIRFMRIVTWSWALLPEGLTALQEPVAFTANSPPGALSGGFVSMTAGGLGSVTYSQAALAGGVAEVSGPCGQGSVTGTPTSCVRTVARTVALVGREFEARTAVRAP